MHAMHTIYIHCIHFHHDIIVTTIVVVINIIANYTNRSIHPTEMWDPPWPHVGCQAMGQELCLKNN